MLNRATAAAALLTAPVFVLAACNSNQNGSKPSTSAPPTTWTQANPSALNVVLKTSDGRPVANASIDFADGYATVEGNNNAVGYVIGGTFSPTENTNIALSYRSKVEHKITGGKANFDVTPATAALRFAART